MGDGAGVSANGLDPIAAFVQRCAQRLAELATAPATAEGARALANALTRSAPRPFQPRWLDALDTLPLLDRSALGEHFAAVAPLLPWTATTRADDGGADFALAPLNEVRDFGDLDVGIMYVRPRCQYPVHRHPPHELYLTIAGTASWRFGGNDEFLPVGADAMIYNRPGDLHSAIAGDSPLVAFYVLWN